MRPGVWVRLLLLAGALGIWAPGGVSAQDRSDPLAQGRAIYNFHCYFCHGYSGDAATLAASYLDPAPRNFRTSDPDTLPRERMLSAVTHGRPGTAMRGYRDRLTDEEIGAVVDFVRQEFMIDQRDNTAYHTVENGWPNHRRYASAYPFATGTIPLDTPWEALTPEQIQGKRLYLASCVSCHDRALTGRPDPHWETRPLSYPRAGYSHRSEKELDAISAASPYALHDAPPPLPDDADSVVQTGEKVFQDNCAFCHAADGTGRNWIGRFMEPHPRDLTDSSFMSTLTAARLRSVIREGLPGTSMPAWKHVLNEAEVNALVRYIDRVIHPLAEP